MNAFRTVSRRGTAATTAGRALTEPAGMEPPRRRCAPCGLGRRVNAATSSSQRARRGAEAEPLGSDRTNPPSPAEPIRSTPTKPLRITCSFPPWWAVALRPGEIARNSSLPPTVLIPSRPARPPARHWHPAVARLSCSIAWSTGRRTPVGEEWATWSRPWPGPRRRAAGRW